MAGKGKPRGRPFPKGVSGNPGGRSKTSINISRMCREYGEEAVERVVEIMRSEDEGRALAASLAILERGLGKPVQRVQKKVEHSKKTPRDMTLGEIEKRLRELEGSETAH